MSASAHIGHTPVPLQFGHLSWLQLTNPFILATMTLKNVSFLALIGMLLLFILVAVDFLNTVEGVLRDIVPAAALLRPLIYMFATITVTVFYWVFNRSQG